MADFNKIANKFEEFKKEKIENSKKGKKTAKILESLSSYKNDIIEYGKKYYEEKGTKLGPIDYRKICSDILLEDGIITNKEHMVLKLQKRKNDRYRTFEKEEDIDYKSKEFKGYIKTKDDPEKVKVDSDGNKELIYYVVEDYYVSQPQFERLIDNDTILKEIMKKKESN